VVIAVASLAIAALAEVVDLAAITIAATKSETTAKGAANTMVMPPSIMGIVVLVDPPTTSTIMVSLGRGRAMNSLPLYEETHRRLLWVLQWMPSSLRLTPQLENRFSERLWALPSAIHTDYFFVHKALSSPTFYKVCIPVCHTY
jgi:hypothetical protein